MRHSQKNTTPVQVKLRLKQESLLIKQQSFGAYILSPPQMLYRLQSRDFENGGNTYFTSRELRIEKPSFRLFFKIFLILQQKQQENTKHSSIQRLSLHEST